MHYLILFKWAKSFPHSDKKSSEASMGSVFGRFVKAFSPMDIVWFTLVSSTGQQNPTRSCFAFLDVVLRRMQIYDEGRAPHPIRIRALPQIPHKQLIFSPRLGSHNTLLIHSPAKDLPWLRILCALTGAGGIDPIASSFRPGRAIAWQSVLMRRLSCADFQAFIP